jgi:hypothetical protein
MPSFAPASTGACFMVVMVAVYLAIFIYVLVLLTRFVKAHEVISLSIARIADKLGGQPPATPGGGPAPAHDPKPPLA